MIFLRHARTSAPAGLCYGRLDLDPGPHDTTETAVALASLPAAGAVWSSPARRCLALAHRLRGNGAPPIVDDRLRELDFGEWEGRPWSEIDRRESYPWAADPWSVAPPGGETFAALHARVAAALSEIPHGTIVVTHAGVIRAARMILTGASFATVFAAPVPFCRPLGPGHGWA